MNKQTVERSSIKCSLLKYLVQWIIVLDFLNPVQCQNNHFCFITEKNYVDEKHIKSLNLEKKD